MTVQELKNIFYTHVVIGTSFQIYVGMVSILYFEEFYIIMKIYTHIWNKYRGYYLSPYRTDVWIINYSIISWIYLPHIVAYIFYTYTENKEQDQSRNAKMFWTNRVFPLKSGWYRIIPIQRRDGGALQQNDLVFLKKMRALWAIFYLRLTKIFIF